MAGGHKHRQMEEMGQPWSPCVVGLGSWLLWLVLCELCGTWVNSLKTQCGEHPQEFLYESHVEMPLFCLHWVK